MARVDIAVDLVPELQQQLAALLEAFALRELQAFARQTGAVR